MHSARDLIKRFSRTLKGSLQRYTSITCKGNGGRNSKGVITAYHRGGGSKTRYKFLASLSYGAFEIPGIVVALSSDQNRNALTALVYYANGVVA